MSFPNLIAGEPLGMMNQHITLMGLISISFTTNLSNDSTIFTNPQMGTMATVRIFMVY